MTWTVSYSYGSISDGQDFDNEEEAQSFYEMIEARIYEFGNGPDNEYESQVTLITLVDNGEEDESQKD
jgi:hypothetical protein